MIRPISFSDKRPINQQTFTAQGHVEKIVYNTAEDIFKITYEAMKSRKTFIEGLAEHFGIPQYKLLIDGTPSFNSRAKAAIDKGPTANDSRKSFRKFLRDFDIINKKGEAKNLPAKTATLGPGTDNIDNDLRKLANSVEIKNGVDFSNDDIIGNNLTGDIFIAKSANLTGKNRFSTMLISDKLKGENIEAKNLDFSGKIPLELTGINKIDTIYAPKANINADYLATTTINGKKIHINNGVVNGHIHAKALTGDVDVKYPVYGLEASTSLRYFIRNFRRNCKRAFQLPQ